MAQVITKTLRLDETNAATYCIADTLELQQSNYAFYLYMDGDDDGYATLNDAAKDVLYPTATARPFKAESKISASSSAAIKWTTNLQFNGTSIHTAAFTSVSQREDVATIEGNSLVSSSTRATPIRWFVDGKYTTTSYRVGHVELSLTFNQYEHAASVAKRATGVDSVSVSNSAPYEGDKVVYSVNLKDGATFLGWFADPQHKVLVSHDRNYEVEGTSDLTLYAYAVLGNGLFVKKEGSWREVISVWQRKGDRWVEISAAEFPLERLYSTNFNKS